MAPLHLPMGAQEILLLRNIGKRPADMILLSLVGPLDETNPVVIAHPARSYDWRFLVGLNVLVVANSTTDPGIIKRILDALMALPTEYLGLWLADRQDGIHVAHGTWRHRCPVTRALLKDEWAQWAGLGLRHKEAACA